eukprot:Nk52_evm43s2152 gene=Nk52_evmTU43s2152
MHLDEEPPEGLCALVYCQLAHGPYLFEACPVEMKEVLRIFFFGLRVALKKYGGYEAYSDESGILAIFNNGQNALLWCVEVQERLMSADWPAKILNLKVCRERYDSRGNLIFRGPRFQMGVHYGEVEQFYDTEQKRITYAGLTVDETYGIHDICPGGNIVASHTAWREIALEYESVAEDVSVKDLGQCDILRDDMGNEYSQFLCLIIPNSLAGRYLEPAYSPSSPRFSNTQRSPRSPRSPKSPRSPRSPRNRIPSSPHSTVSSNQGMDPLSSWTICESDLELEKEPFTYTTTGAIFRGVWNHSVDIVAKKFCASALTESLKIDLLTEIYLRSQLRHPNINTFYGAVLEPEVIMITEWSPQGHLRKVLYDKSCKIPYRKRLGMVNDIARALYYLHTHKPTILHRNLTSKAVLVSGDYTCKLGDFALACIKYGEQDSLTDLNYWSAPEIMNGSEEFNEAADVFSFGLLVFEIICRKYPCASELSRRTSIEFVEDVLDGYRPPIPDYVPNKCRELIERCWHQEANQRPTMQEVLKLITGIRKELDACSNKITDNENTPNVRVECAEGENETGNMCVIDEQTLDDIEPSGELAERIEN